MLHFQVTAAYKLQMAQKWVKTELTSITNGKNAWFPGYSVGLLLNSTDHLPNLPYFPKWDVLPYLKITHVEHTLLKNININLNSSPLSLN